MQAAEMPTVTSSDIASPLSLSHSCAITYIENLKLQYSLKLNYTKRNSQDPIAVLVGNDCTNHRHIKERETHFKNTFRLKL